MPRKMAGSTENLGLRIPGSSKGFGVRLPNGLRVQMLLFGAVGHRVAGAEEPLIPAIEPKLCGKAKSTHMPTAEVTK